MRIDPLTLRLFLAVCETGTIALAAQREHIVASALSKRISQLEELFGIPLLDRSNKGAVPTAAGAALIGLARSALNELDQIASHMQDHVSGLRGRVRIAANISATTQFLPAQLSAFAKTHPGVQIQFKEDVSPNVTRAVVENLTDIGIFTVGTHLPDNEGQLQIIPYRSDEFVVITSRDHPLSGRKSVRLSDILGFEFVALHKNRVAYQLITSASQRGTTVKFGIQVNSYGSLCRMVEAGLGIGILPFSSAKQYSKALKIRILRLNEEWNHSQLAICVRDVNTLPVAAHALLLHLKGVKGS